MLLRYRYKDIITNDIIYVSSFTAPSNINIKPNSLTIVGREESTATNITTVEVLLTESLWVDIAPLNLGTYKIKISKKISQDGAPTALFNIAKTVNMDFALINDIINIASNDNEVLEVQWNPGEIVKIRKYNLTPSNTYDGIYNVIIY
jgi:hypothetical protein